MFKTLFKKELLDHLLGFRFAVSAVLCLLLMIISVVILVGDYSARRNDFHRNMTAYKAEAEEEGSYFDLARNGVKVDRPPAKLQVPAYGLEKDPDRTARVPASGIPKVLHELYLNPLLSLFPVADVVFVVATVLSLLAFVVSYDAVTGEREQETIKLLMSYNVPRDRLILAKWLGGYVSLVTPFLLSAGIGCVVIQLADIDLGGSDWMAFGLLIGLSLVFLAAMFSIGLFVSCICRYSATSITVLVLIWVICVLVVPNISPYVAAEVVPVKPFSAVESEIKQETASVMRSFMGRLHGRRSELRRAFSGSGQEAAQARQKLMETMNQARTELQENIGRIEETKLGEFQRGQNRQITATKNISRISPIAAYVYAATDVASTGVRKQEHFYQSVQEYQRQFETYVDRKMEGALSQGFMAFFGGQQEYDVSDMPEFRYDEEELVRRVDYSLWDIVVLAGYSVVFFLASFVGFMKADLL
jgi:ABC-type transport system involved in multi-copper enzyme maturation permease subunit